MNNRLMRILLLLFLAFIFRLWASHDNSIQGKYIILFAGLLFSLYLYLTFRSSKFGIIGIILLPLFFTIGYVFSDQYSEFAIYKLPIVITLSLVVFLVSAYKIHKQRSANKK
jgi:hypothetical protein